MLQNKKVLVTGSARGIGLAIVTEFAKNGASVVIHGLCEDHYLQSVATDITAKYKNNVLISNADLADPAGITDLADMVMGQWGGVDVLVNNAGMQYVSPIETFPRDQWDRVLAVNLSAAFLLAQRFIPAMKKTGWGRIINIASAHGMVASIHKSAYVASKHGLLGLTKVMALELANDNITSNAICPGWVQTDIVDKQVAARANATNIPIQQAAVDLISEKMPYHQFVQAADIASLAVFLCGDAARAITGASLPIDGGWTAQ